MDNTAIDRMYEEISELIQYLEKDGEVSLRSTADENFRKALLLAAASYFEHRICEAIISFTGESSSANHLLVEFVRNKALSRQFHTLFDWNSRNANKFFSLFGDTFSNFMKNELRKDDSLSTSIGAFMELGTERNRLVHQDFGTFPLEKTAKEIYDLYLAAQVFVEAIPEKMRQCLNQPQAG